MKRYKIIISLAAIICGLMIACDNTDYSNKAPFDQVDLPGRKRHRSEAESGSRTDKRIQCPARD